MKMVAFGNGGGGAVFACRGRGGLGTTATIPDSDGVDRPSVSGLLPSPADPQPGKLPNGLVIEEMPYRTFTPTSCSSAVEGCGVSGRARLASQASLAPVYELFGNELRLTVREWGGST